ncbi:hypothetical protein [Brachybacterium sp. AOP3-A1-3]|uniref:hypothetical protein n=1 Tax=Brachybacterium sp. AOP3-A1-3 TaxID=3457699 RepID=UPI0040336AAC
MSPRPDSPATPTGSTPRRRAVGDRAMQRVLILALVVGMGLDVVVIVIAAMSSDSPALVGALIGTGLTLVVVLPTLAITFAGPRMTPVSMAATVLGSWAVKMLVVILVLIIVRDMAGVSTRWIGLALLVGAVSAVAVEVTLLARSRQPLDVEQVADPSEDQSGS